MPTKKISASKETTVEVPTDEAAALAAVTYDSNKRSMKTLGDECDRCKDVMFAYLESKGVKATDTTVMARLDIADKTVTFKKTVRASSVLLPEAIDVLRSHGLTDCIETVEIVRDDILSMMVDNGKVSEEILKKIVSVKTSSAVSVQVKPRVDEA